MLLEEDDCDLTAVIFDGVDKLQHLCWRFLDPAVDAAAPPDFEERIESLCHEYFAALDGHIAALVETAGEGTEVILCSDHGFGPTWEIFYPNVLLERQGFLTWADGVQVDSQGRHTTHGHRNPTVLFDWNRTLAYALTSGNNGIYLNVRETPDAAGVSPRDYVSVRDQVANALRSFVDPATDEPVVKDVLTREQAFPGDHSHLAPDLTLVLRDHGFMSILRADGVLRPRAQIMGTHAPDGMFIAHGPAVRQGRSPRLQIAQVAPLILHLLGVPIPIDLEASLPSELLDHDWIAAHPPELGAPTEVPAAYFEQGAPSLDRAGEELVLDRLRALGYVE
jgi:predicted AlkP superfamily phosphohydrolase/phosphomutase